MTKSDRTCYLKFASGLIITGLLVATEGNCAFAQIESDRTLGSQRSIVKPDVIKGLPSDRISGGARRGANLFHSFREFNIDEGRGAYFTNPVGVENILSRVTGTNRSNILGTLGVLGNANLFLINPNGIIFGTNASLDVKGSFVASTANNISFADGTQFSTNNPQAEPLLTVSVPTGLQIGANPGTIRVQGQVNQNQPEIPLLQNLNRSSPDLPFVVVNELRNRIKQGFEQVRTRPDGLRVLPGKTLALVGGDVSLEGGTLRAEGNPIVSGGQIELGSVADSGKVSLTKTSNGFTLGYENVSSFGNIDLSQQSLLDVSGAASGDVRVQGNNITLKDGSIILAATFGNRDGGEIFMRSQHLNVVGNSIIGAFAPAAGISGDVTLEVGNLSVQNAIIGTFADGEAATGKIAVRSTDTVRLIGTLFSGPFGQLPGGLFAITRGSRQGGDAIIQTRQLLVSDGALLAVSNGGEGQGGTIQIGASDIKLIGQTNPSFFRSGIFATTFGTGRGGNINIETQRLTLENGANVLTGTRLGPGGNVVINASDFIEIIGTEAPGIITDVSANTLRAEAAGNVQIETDQLIIRDRGEVTAAALGELGTGAAGNIDIEARSIYLDNQGAITTNTRSGAFGNIELQSQFLLLRRGSKITTNATLGTATGGDIDIDTQFLVAVPQENSDITANAVRGRGGNVKITTQGIFGIEFRESETLLSDITADSEFGVSGNVQIDAPDTDPSRRVVNLPTLTVEPSVVQACTPSDTQQSEFVITGRGGLPPSAQEAIGTDAIGIDWVTLNPQQSTSTEVRETSVAPEAQENAQSPDEKHIIEAQGLVVGSDGKVILTAQAPTVTPHNPWLPNDSCKGS
jgi:filamentous hemagglutinin family protein